jgi:hypothetical protein
MNGKWVVAVGLACAIGIQVRASGELACLDAT